VLASPVMPETAFTIKNLMDVENSVGDRLPEVEGRFARKYLDSDHLGVSYFRYAPGYRSRLGHSHREQEEAYIVVGGSGRIRLDGEIHPLRPWDVVRVSPQAVRAFEAGETGLELIAVGSDRPEGGDGMMSDAPWPDES
jgi:quercetin dioxygenase-like cupin family protein